MRSRKLISFVLYVVVLNGCSASLPTREFRHQEDAGTVQVAVQSIAPFDEDFVNQLQPELALADEAAAGAIAQTRIQQLERVREILADIGIGLPQDTNQLTKTLNADGTTTVTGKDEKTPPTTSSIPTAPTAGTSSTSAPTQTETETTTDLSLTYRSVLALKQEIALLNRQVRDAAVSRGTRPYVVRFLVTLNPSARREPYNAFATISFFAESEEKQLPQYLARVDAMQKLVAWAGNHDYCNRPLEVVPLFVTDNLESSADNLGLQSGVNVGAAVGGTPQNILARLGFRARAENKTKTQGRSFNALQTIGRVSTNTIETRLGAFISGNDFEMVPRTYNVTVLALVPTYAGVLDEYPTMDAVERAEARHAANEIPACRQIAFTSLYRFTDGRTGRTLKSKFGKAADKDLEQVLKNADLDRTALADVRRLMTLAQIDDYEAFRNSLTSKPEAQTSSSGGTANTVEPFAYLRAELLESYANSHSEEIRPEAVRLLWADLVNVARRSGRSYGHVSVPSSDFQMFPVDAVGSIVDDHKKAVLTVAGARNLSSTALDGRMEFAVERGTWQSVYASKVTVSRDGRRAAFEFDSPFIFGDTAPRDVRVTVTRDGGLKSFQAGSTFEWEGALECFGREFCSRLTYVEKPEKPEAPKAAPAIAMSVTSPHIVRNTKESTGSVAVSFATLKENAPKKVRIAVSGGFINSTSPQILPNGLDYVGASSGTYVLQLNNLAPRGKVTIRAYADDNGKRGDVIGETTVDVIDN